MSICHFDSLFEIYKLMTNYFNLPLEGWEQYAKDVCLAVDQTVKDTAEQFFFGFVQAVHLETIVNLMQQGSDLLVFALFSYIGKSPQAFIRECQPFFVLIGLISEWRLHEFNFSRPGRDPFQPFVTKTIMLTLGTLMKLLYQSSDTSNQLIKFLQPLPLNFFKIYVLKTFIEIVETVDSEMGYMRFRTMVYSFQDFVIPMICDTLVPFFNNFEDGLRVSDLTAKLQSKLDVSESTVAPTDELLQISRQQQMQSEYVLMLLKKIVEFNYNITYTEYESEQVIDTCLITYPEKVINKIINNQFLGSLFYVITKVMESKVGQKKNVYLGIVLDCLAKIMQARLGYICDNSKERFICAAIKGLMHLLKVCQQLQSQVLLEGILTCNKKLFMSVELNYIQKVLKADPEKTGEDLYNDYIRELTWMILQVVKQSCINTENTLLNEALEVVNKMVSNLGYKEFEIIEGSTEFYLKLLREIAVSYVSSLCQPRYLFPSPRVIWVTENKQAINNLFQLYKKLSSYVYDDLFMAVDCALENYINNQKQELVILSNILFLLSELIDRHFLERNVNMNKAKNKEIAILASTVKKASILVQEYANNRQSFQGVKDAEYLDIAVLIFSQSILVEFLGSFESTTSIKIKQKVYLLMIFGENFNEELEMEENQSEPTIIQFMNIVFQFLNKDMDSVDAEAKILYALEIIQRVIFKLKWNMRREIFLKSDIFKRLLAFFDEYFSKCYPAPEVMSKVGKIIVSLNFDDILDEYKFRINKFVARLPTDDCFGPVFYYLMGIFEGIQPGNICRYFWNRLKKHLNLPQFFSQMFKKASESNTDRDYKDVCKLCKLICLNKGLRTGSNYSIVYQMFTMFLPNLIWFIKHLSRNEQLNIDLFGDSMAQIMELFNGTINGTHVNIYLIDESSKGREGGQLGQEYVYEYLKMLILLCQQVKLYPRLEEILLTSFSSMNKEILEYIYDHENSKVADMFSLLVLRMTDLTNEYIVSQLNGNRLVEDKLLKIIDGLRFFNHYLNRKTKILHKKNITLNINKYHEMSNRFAPESPTVAVNKNQTLIVHLLNLIMANHKNNATYLRSISKLVYELNKLYSPYIYSALGKMMIPAGKMQEVQAIMENYREDMEENFVEEFKNWVKDYDVVK